VLEEKVLNEEGQVLQEEGKMQISLSKSIWGEWQEGLVFEENWPKLLCHWVDKHWNLHPQL
jgi:hypothetical protein